MTRYVFTEANIIAMLNKVGDFTSRELPGLMNWVRKLLDEDPRCCLADNPPNHVYDVADGTMDLTIGADQVDRKLEHASMVRGGNFAYTVHKTGKATELFAFIKTLSESERLEAAMAIYVEYSGNFVCNSTEWRNLAETLKMEEELDNPFYKGVCDAILDRFVTDGIIKH